MRRRRRSEERSLISCNYPGRFVPAEMNPATRRPHQISPTPLLFRRRILMQIKDATLNNGTSLRAAALTPAAAFRQDDGQPLLALMAKCILRYITTASTDSHTYTGKHTTTASTDRDTYTGKHTTVVSFDSNVHTGKHTTVLALMARFTPR